MRIIAKAGKDMGELFGKTFERGRAWINEADVVQIDTTIPTLAVLGAAAVAAVSTVSILAYKLVTRS